MHPVIPYLIGSVVVALAGTRLRKITQLMVPAASFLTVLSLSASGSPLPVQWSWSVWGQTWAVLRADSLAMIFVYAFLLFSFFANLFALHIKNRLFHVAANLYAGTSIGAALAGDLVVLFIFWELMAISSAVLIWNRRNPSASGAVYRYLLIHGTGGLLFFGGILLRISSGVGIAFSLQTMDMAGILIFLAFMVNAAVPPVHAWLPDAYPAGTPAGSVYLSAFTTKVAVYAFARGYAGEELLIGLGVLAAVYGVIYALMENDIRRLLSYHLVCQVGYMLVGIGIGGPLGISAGTGHAVGNILFKGLLFMATGAVLHMTWRSKLSDLGGLRAKAPLVFFFFMVGGLAISGMPFLNGYVTKSLLLDAAGKAHLGWVELSLLLVAVGTFLSIPLKLAYFAFWHRPYEGRRIIKLPPNCYWAMGLTSAVCLLIGIYPEVFFRLLPSPVSNNVYTPAHVIHTLQLLAGGLLAFLVILRMLHQKPHISLDADWFYRKSGALFVRGICHPLRQGQEVIQQRWTSAIRELYKEAAGWAGKQGFTPVGYSLIWIAGGFFLASLWVLLLRP